MTKGSTYLFERIHKSIKKNNLLFRLARRQQRAPGGRFTACFINQSMRAVYSVFHKSLPVFCTGP